MCYIGYLEVGEEQQPLKKWSVAENKSGNCVGVTLVSSALTVGLLRGGGKNVKNGPWTQYPPQNATDAANHCWLQHGAGGMAKAL